MSHEARIRAMKKFLKKRLRKPIIRQKALNSAEMFRYEGICDGRERHRKCKSYFKKM